MVAISSQKDMLKSIVGMLEPKGDIRPMKREIHGIKAHYILLGEKGQNGLILLMDRPTSFRNIEELYRIAVPFTKENSVDHKANVGVVFYKDGDTFFRSAVESNDERQNSYYRPSLSHYRDPEKKKIMLLSPAERFVKNIKESWTQYFQPKSSALETGIESFKFGNVEFVRDIGPGHPAYGFAPPIEDSKRLYIWHERRHYSGPLTLKDGFLVPTGMAIQKTNKTD